MELIGEAKRVRIYVNEGDTYGHTSTPEAVIELLKRENAAGATVYRATEGFGGSGVVHTLRIADVVTKLPILVEWVDSPERVARLLPRLQEIVRHGLITVDDTRVVLFNPHPLRDLPATLSAADVMSRNVARVAPETPLRDVVELLVGKSFRAVPVVKHQVPIGLITNTDLVERGGLSARVELLESIDPRDLGAELARLGASKRTAAEVMTPKPFVVRARAALPEVAEVMTRRKLKRLPVIDEAGRLAGMISRLDLLRTVAGAMTATDTEPRPTGLAGDAPIGSVMRRDVPTVHTDTHLGEVLQAVISTRLNQAVVVDADRHVLGLVTDGELLERVTSTLRPSALRSLMHRLPFAHVSEETRALEQHARAKTAKDLMTEDVTIARPSDTLESAIANMLKTHQKLIAVVDEDSRLIGAVDRADLLRGLTAPPE